MNIFITSSCSKKALKQTRRIIDSFGYRLSKSTWSVKITNEGLSNLIILLRKSARKNTAISIFNSRNMELMAFIGSKKKYCPKEEGVLAIKIKGLKKMDNYLKIAKIAGYLHDIGKANKEFQTKIRLEKQEKKRDTFRHELVSVLLIEYFLLKKECSFYDFLVQFFVKEEKSLVSKKDSFSLRIIKLIILTHHKTPVFDRENTEDLVEDQFKLFHNIKIEDKEGKQTYKKWNPFYGLEIPIKEFILNNKEFFDNYIDFNILLKDTKIKRLINEIKTINLNENDFNTLIYFGRFSLMSGDYTGSSDKNYYTKSKDNLYKSEELYAKSFEPVLDNESDFVYYVTQNLKTHLSCVSKNAMKAMELILEEKSNLSTLNTNSLNKLLTIKDNTPTKFQWQSKNIEFVKESKTELAKFYSVNSSTGSGKTKFSLMLAMTVSKDKRLITALGLRNLTLQTHAEYEKEIGKTEVTTIIGSKPFKDIFELNNDSSIDNDYDLGKENTFSNRHSKITDRLTNFMYKDLEDYFDSPALVTTVDNIIKATMPEKSGRFIKPFLKIKNADLILDEVDNFDPADILSIGKLVFLSGLFNRNVIISTATANKYLSNFLFSMFSKGISLYKKRKKIKEDTAFVFLSDLKIKNGEFFTKKIKYSNNFTKDLFSIIDKKENSFISLIEANKKHKVKIKDITISNIQKHILELSENNKEVFENKIQSIGLIRIANIDNALRVFRSMAKKINVNEDTIIFPVLYHSQIPMLYRSFLEKELDLTLTRKEKKLNETTIFNKFKEYYGKKNIIVVVIATPVEEVGRDHDFDWAIAEPSSIRSILQIAGRILRHRNIVPEHTNYYIMNKNFSLQNGVENSNLCYTRPGFEKTDNLFIIEDKKTLSEDEINNAYFSEKESIGGSELKRDINSIAPYLENGLKQSFVISPNDKEFMSIKEEENIKKTLNEFLYKYNNDILNITNHEHNESYGLSLRFRSGSENELFFINLNKYKKFQSIGYFNENKEFDRAEIVSFEIESDFDLSIIYLEINKYIEEIEEKVENFNYFKFNSVQLSLNKEKFDYNIYIDSKERLYLGIFKESQVKKVD